MYKLSLFILVFLSLIDPKPVSNSTKNGTIKNHTESITSKDEISILTLNTWGLPIRLAGHDQKTRFEKMPTAIDNIQADIICLQECFSKSLRNRLQQKLLPNYYHLTNLDCNRSWKGLLNMDCHGGLITLSTFPIINEKFIPFDKTNDLGIIEKIGAKGFLISSIDLGHDTINIVNTHLYSGNNDHAEKSRLLQVQKIENQLQKYLIEYPHNTVLTGDLNIAHPDIAVINDHIELSNTYTYLESNMCLIDSKAELTESDFTMDPNQNPYSDDKDGGQQKLDYCMLLDSNPSKPYSFVESNVVFSGDNAISDHMGLLSILDIGIEKHETTIEIVNYNAEESVLDSW